VCPLHDRVRKAVPHERGGGVGEVVKEHLRSSLTDRLLETLAASDDESDDKTGEAES